MSQNELAEPGEVDRAGITAFRDAWAWKHLFHAWLPQSGYEPTGDPTMEAYRRSPVELGWETFDNDC